MEIVNVMHWDATMNAACGSKYKGLDQFNAWERLWADMEAAGLVLKVEPHMQVLVRLMDAATRAPTTPSLTLSGSTPVRASKPGMVSSSSGWRTCSCSESSSRASAPSR